MDYFRKATKFSPTILMDSTTKSALISGNSLCKDIAAYAEVIQNIKSQLENSSYQYFNIKLNVFNVHAAKSLLDILRAIKSNSKKGFTSVHWICDNVDKEMREMINDYSELLDMKINISSN